MTLEADGFEKFLTGELAETSRLNLRRELKTLESPQMPRIVFNDRTYANFSSNDYLGLASHPALMAAACEEWTRGGFGSGASRLICGNMSAHEKLESELADFKRTESALTFGSGYAAAMGTIPALCGKNDVIILDKLSHACLVDAARLSGAVLRVFPHNDLERLESHLRWARRTHSNARILVVVESVYSMDGDLAPLLEIVELKDRHGAWLFLDEAHGVGVLGPNGGGLAEELQLADRIEIQMGTLGKAFGAHGAYIAGSRALRDFLINRARSLIFSTSPPPPVVAAANQALHILRSPEGKILRESLWRNIRLLAEAFEVPAASSAIIPVIIGPEAVAVDISHQLLDAGFIVSAIRFPTVARGSARLRLTAAAGQDPTDITALATAWKQCALPYIHKASGVV
jgi:8-amino-7-oxononanoate synthase